MTILVVGNSSWNLSNFRTGLFKALVAKGYRVVALSLDGPERAQMEAVGVVFVPLRHMRRRGKNPFRDLLLAYELSQHYKRESPKAVLHFTIKPVIYGSLAAYWRQVPSIATLTGLGHTFIEGRSTSLLVRGLYRIVLRLAKLVFFHNPDDWALFLEDGLVSTQRSRVVGGSGVDLKHYRPSGYEVAVAGKYLLVARLLTDKGIREYVAAARIALAADPALSFHILGPPDPDNPAGIADTELQAWVEEGVITYDGATDDIRPHLQSASVVVLPSYREGCPRVLLEAAATGRALITTDVPGCREVVRDGWNGWLVPVRDAATLAEAMLNAGKTPDDQLAKMGANGRQLVEEKFSEEVVIANYLAALDELTQ